MLTGIKVLVLLFLLGLSGPVNAGDGDIALVGEEGSLAYNAAEWEGHFFAPARVLEELLDIELRWFGTLKLLRFNLDGLDFRLRADDPNMQAGDRVLDIEPPRIVDNQLWIPIKDFLEILQFDVVFDEADNALNISSQPVLIKRVDWDREQQKLTVEAEEEFEYELANEGFFILETQGVQLDYALAQYTLPAGLEFADNQMISDYLARPLEVKEERGRHFSLTFQFPARLLEVDFRREMGQMRIAYEGPPLEYELIKGAQDHVLYLNNAITGERFQAPGVEYSAREGVNPEIELQFSTPGEVEFDFQTLEKNRLVLNWVGDGYIEDISWAREDEDGKIIITTSRPVDLESFILEDPKRLVFDLGKIWLPGSGSSITIEDMGIKQVRYSQYEPEKVRLVLDLEDFPDFAVEEWEGEPYRKVINFTRDPSLEDPATIEERLADRFPELITERDEYQYDYPHLIAVDKEEGSGFDRYHIDLSDAAEYSVHTLSRPDRVVVDIEDTRVGTENLRTFNSTPVKGIRVSQLSNDPDVVRIVFDLEYRSDYKVKTPDHSERITLQFPRSPLAGQIIVIDPGHGGMDPGAIGPSGVMEKDVVLDISLKLEEMLHDAGAIPMMTRYRDEFVALRARADFANQARADAFISIHANSVARDIPEGTETYVRNQADYSTQTLGKMVQSQVVETLGLLDRGVKQKNYAVLHPLKMPGILLEVAFLSNYREERILNDPEWQQRIAEAIFRGLSSYFSDPNRGGR